MAQDNEKLTTSTIVESLDESHSSARRAPKEKPREESSMLVGMAEVAGAEALSPFKQRGGYQKSPHWETNLTSLNVSDKPREKDGNVFSMLSKVVERLQKDQTRALVIAPLWRTQDWFPKMRQMLISQPVLLQKEESLLQVTHDMTKVYPLWPKLQLMACCLSGQDSDIKRFQRKLAMSSWNCGGLAPANCTECLWISGGTLPEQKMKIPFIQL